MNPRPRTVGPKPRLAPGSAGSHSLAPLSSIILAGLAAAAPGAWADDPHPSVDPTAPQKPHATALSELSLADLLDVRYDEVSGASRRSQKTWQAPASVTVVDRLEIQAFGYRTLADALESTPGTYVTTDRTYSFLGVRGFSPPGDYNGRVLLLVDSHRANDNIYDSALLGSEGVFDVDLIQRLEVIRGPASSMYGSSAFFGVLNVVPRRGADLQGAEFSAEAGSWQTYRARATAGYEFDSGVEFLISATHFESDGESEIRLPYRDVAGQPPAFARDLDGFHGHNLYATLSWMGFRLSAVDAQRDKALADAGVGSALDHPRGAVRDTTRWADLSFDHTFANDARLVARLSVHDTSYLGWYPYDVADPGDPPDIVLNRDDVQGSWWGSEATYEHPLGDRFILTGGVEYRDNFRQNQSNFDEGLPATDYGTVEDSSSVLGVFIQVDWTLSEQALLSAGVRYDETRGDSQLSPRIGLIGRPWEGTTLKLLHGTAFRAPNAYEHDFVASYFVGNANLDPELVRSFELNAEQSLLENRLAASGSLFYNRVQDLIAYQETGGIGTFVNTDDLHAFGAEVSVEYRWPKGGFARVTYSVQHAEDVHTEARLPNAPEHLARLQVRVPLWRDRIYLSPEVRFVDDTLGNSGRVPGYWHSQITLFTRDLLPGLEASASIYNLFDTEYDHPISSEYVGNSIPQPGRTFRVKLTYRF